MNDFSKRWVGRSRIFPALALAAFCCVAEVHAQPIPVVPLEFKDARQPQVSVNAQKEIYVAFGQGETIYCASLWGEEKTFLPPMEVATLKGLSLGMRRGPRIVCVENGELISAISRDTGDIELWLSENRGTCWRPLGRVNNVAHAAREGLHAMASDGRERVFVAWLDLRNDKTEVWGALSNDGGKTWDKNSVVYKSPSGHVCECCHPSVVFTLQGEIVVMWRNWIGGSRDMYLASSKDRKTFGAARKLGQGTWPLQGCPMDGGGLANGQDGKLLSVWRRKGNIFWSGDGVAEKLLGDGRQPVLAAGNGKTYFAWQQDGTLVAQTEASAAPVMLWKNAAYAAISSGGEKQSPVVVWESTAADGPRIWAEVLK